MNITKHIVVASVTTAAIGAQAASTNEVFNAATAAFTGAALDMVTDIPTLVVPIIIVGFVIAAIYLVYRVVRRALSASGGR